jgi:peptidyl-prolyl cis-trans isomerase C
MPNMLRKILNEPLFQFLLAGAALFALSSFVGDRPGSDDKRIVVSPERIEQLKAVWQKQWQRPPSEQELKGLIDQYAREEVLYREGLAMGLDRDDTVIRRRVAQKVEFLVQDLAAAQSPADGALKKYFRNHPEQFRTPAQVSFTQVYFNSDRRGPRAEADARELLQRINSGGSDVAATSGDRFLLNDRYTEVTQEQVARDFGREFAQAVFVLPTGGWRGPLRSGYGVHLVRVTDRMEASLPAFEQVRDRVRAAYLDELRRRQNEAIIRKMTERYQIVVKSAPEESAPSVAQNRRTEERKGAL